MEALQGFVVQRFKYPEIVDKYILLNTFFKNVFNKEKREIFFSFYSDTKYYTFLRNREIFFKNILKYYKQIADLKSKLFFYIIAGLIFIKDFGNIFQIFYDNC